MVTSGQSCRGQAAQLPCLCHVLCFCFLLPCLAWCLRELLPPPALPI